MHKGFPKNVVQQASARTQGRHSGTKHSTTNKTTNRAKSPKRCSTLLTLSCRKPRINGSLGSVCVPGGMSSSLKETDADQSSSNYQKHVQETSDELLYGPVHILECKHAQANHIMMILCHETKAQYASNQPGGNQYLSSDSPLDHSNHHAPGLDSWDF